ncbi:MAG: hypothetical protein WA441_03760 [Methyloceanibacter sp.]|jgi:hypothetical protein
MDSKAVWFALFAQRVSHITGRPITFILAVTTIVVDQYGDHDHHLPHGVRDSEHQNRDTASLHSKSTS